MGGMKSLLDVARLPKHIENAFEELNEQIEYLIDESLDGAYYGLPYGDTHPTALCTRNRPINIARAHQLLTEMWGDLINAEAIDNACERFVDIQTASCGNEATAVAWFIAVRVGKIAAEI